MKKIRKLIKESILNVINESSRYTPGEALNGALRELDSISQGAKIQAMTQMGVNPLNYFYPFPSTIGNQYSMGMEYLGTDRTRKVVKMRDLGNGRKMPMKIPIPVKDELTGLPMFDEDGNPIEDEMTVKETIPLGGRTTFSDKLVRARIHVVPLQKEIEIYALKGGINYLNSLPLFRYREGNLVDKGVFVYSYLTSSNTPQGADRSDVFGIGSEIEKAMIALGKYAGIIPETYNHEEIILMFKAIREKYEAAQQRQSAAAKEREEEEELAALLASLEKDK